MSDREQDIATTSARYTRFADVEAHGRSPLCETIVLRTGMARPKDVRRPKTHKQIAQAIMRLRRRLVRE